jgi:hypothetical protein
MWSVQAFTSPKIVPRVQQTDLQHSGNPSHLSFYINVLAVLAYSPQCKPPHAATTNHQIAKGELCCCPLRIPLLSNLSCAESPTFGQQLEEAQGDLGSRWLFFFIQSSVLGLNMWTSIPTKLGVKGAVTALSDPLHGISEMCEHHEHLLS